MSFREFIARVEGKPLPPKPQRVLAPEDTPVNFANYGTISILREQIQQAVQAPGAFTGATQEAINRAIESIRHLNDAPPEPMLHYTAGLDMSNSEAPAVQEMRRQERERREVIEDERYQQARRERYTTDMAGGVFREHYDDPHVRELTNLSRNTTWSSIWDVFPTNTEEEEF